MSEIKINHSSVDWEAQDVILYTKNGVRHYQNGLTSDTVSEHAITVDLQYSPFAYDINKVNDECIAIDGYHINHHSTYRVGDFKGEKATLRFVKSIYNGYRRNDAESNNRAGFQIRIYKDMKIVLLRYVTFTDVGRKYFVCSNSDDGWFWGDNLSDQTSQSTLERCNINFITTEEELYKLAHKATKNDIRDYFNNYNLSSIYNTSSDIKTRTIQDPSGYYTIHWSKETQKLIDDFLQIDAPENKERKDAYIKRCGRVYTTQVNSISYLVLWITARNNSNKAALTKKETGEKLATILGDFWTNTKAYIGEGKKYPYGVNVWTRNEEWIVCGVFGERGNYYSSSESDTRKLFAYNIKTKKRFYGEFTGTTCWTFPVPSCVYIDEKCSCNDKTKYDYKSGEYKIIGRPATVILNDLSLEELFANTNIEWLLKSPEGLSCKIRNHDTKERSWNKQAKPLEVRECFKPDYIGTVAFMILITTGEPMQEMLLKSKLFNMYFHAIDEKFNSGSYYGVCFGDLDSKQLQKRSYMAERVKLPYHSKEKNLKKMFGMNLNLLRAIDKMMDLQQLKDDYSDSKSYRRRVPTMNGVGAILGCDLNNIDDKMIQDIMEFQTATERQHSRNELVDLKNVVQQAMRNCTPKVRLQYLLDYKDCLEEYKDYLEIRNQLQNLNNVRPEEVKFSEKLYPIKPRDAQKFIQYFDNMEDFTSRYRHWSSRLTPDGFKNAITNRYSKAISQNKVQFTKDKLGRLTGALITMTAAEHLMYLHDEGSQIVSFFQDEAKQDLFTNAVKRVKPLEYTNEKFGLCMVAPQFVRDLVQEGKDLSHCVGSYVDAINAGKENIMFCRRNDMPEQSYYTVELVEATEGVLEIRQIHGYCNNNTSPEDQAAAYDRSKMEVYNKTFDVLGFIKTWAKDMGKKINEGSIRSNYRALCHL